MRPDAAISAPFGRLQRERGGAEETARRLLAAAELGRPAELDRLQRLRCAMLR